MIFENLFCNFLTHEDIIIDNDSIERYCYKKMKEDKDGRIMSNSGGWQSNDFFLPAPEICELTSIVSFRMRELAKKINLKNVHKLYLDNFWININKKSNSNVPHNHPKSVLTAVYYVKVPIHSGDILFHTPNNYYDECIEEFMIEKYNQYNSSTFRLKPSQNKLIFFPSYMMHSIEENKSDHDRISIAFNSNYVD